MNEKLDTICPKCKGKGVIYSKFKSEILNIEYQGVIECECNTIKFTLANMERGWAGLSKVKDINKESPLENLINKNAWITIKISSFKAHLKRTVKTQKHTWFFKVINDVDLITSWLHNIETNSEIWDPDFGENTYLTGNRSLPNLIIPPKLLIIVLGVKVARNAAMPEVFLETLYQRRHEDKPTWIIDQPDHPLDINHKCYSNAFMDFMRTWDHERIKFNGETKTVNKNTEPFDRPTLSTKMPE